ncbi:hypothetical protein DDE18_06765 [Nocardioides gansuensis]|uniref:Cytochrome b561 bacterial/Ni-hydrogenase domain-containing protein n=1 Tax=Nocardioides gansuensis TaxID=2138300 RepID=A0A2T8FE32_9ACTN|nr:cytochrome b/b6 domain-containing protein [Nocardioides gansuensis]PVG83976.1 hypothetical protein DDE18_06765 [Nocardioides gansuensis]
MRLRNGEHGYGAVTKALHWLTVFAFATQFYVGYTMETEADVRAVDCDPPGEDQSGGDTSDPEEERLDRLEERCEAAQERREEQAEGAVGTAWSELTGGGNVLGDGVSSAEVHVLLGLLIISLAVLRLLWRRMTPLPPWDPRLTPGDQRVVHATETVLLTLQFVVPATGILLVAADDDLLWLHVAGHLAFFAALGAHLGMVLGKRLLPRMLPGVRQRSRIT